MQDNVSFVWINDGLKVKHLQVVGVWCFIFGLIFRGDTGSCLQLSDAQSM